MVIRSAFLELLELIGNLLVGADDRLPLVGHWSTSAAGITPPSCGYRISPDHLAHRRRYLQRRADRT
jgi:hypothetical protein